MSITPLSPSSDMATGLLVLSSPLTQVLPRFQASLAEVTKHGLLYVHLLPSVSGWPPQVAPQSVSSWSNIVTRIYAQAARNPEVDVRVLMAGIKSNLDPIGIRTKIPIDCIYFEPSLDSQVINGYLEAVSNNEGSASVQHQILSDTTTSTSSNSDNESLQTDDSIHDFICMGGTFDNLHSGHKIMLAEALIRCQKRLTIGVTSNAMLKSKVLTELITPCHERISFLQNYLEDCDPSLDYNIVPICDAFGPAITDEKLEMIIGSEETKRGCEKINEIRTLKKFKPLDIYLIKMLEDPARQSESEEWKISSSSQRMRKLGSQLRPPLKEHEPGTPYVIGLTGGSASGKSNIAKRLGELGAFVIDCDALGHRAYEPGTQCFREVVEAFGQDVVQGDGSINRQVLGAKVFGGPAENKQKLESIVWPEIMRMAKAKIDEATKEGFQVVVLDAAVLLSAGWETECHQVWVSVIPRDEAVKRIVERDGKTEEQAKQRLDSQIPNQEIVDRANVVFCSLWEYEFTRKQVIKAWNTLQKQYLK